MKRRRLPLLLIVLLILLIGCYLFYQKYIENKFRVSTDLEFSSLPSGFNGFGIDVSHYQGKIDWDLFRDSLQEKIGFVYFKVSEGANIVDETWEVNNKELDRVGILNGGYHFFIPTVDVHKQVDNFLNHYKPEQNDLPPVLDVETEISDKTKLIEGVRTWLDKVKEKSGRQPIIYTSYHMYKNILKASFMDYRFWVASYSRKEDRFTDEDILFWQYTDKGILPGIENYVDINYSRINYTKD